MSDKANAGQWSLPLPGARLYARGMSLFVFSGGAGRRR